MGYDTLIMYPTRKWAQPVHNPQRRFVAQVDAFGSLLFTELNGWNFISNKFDNFQIRLNGSFYTIHSVFIWNSLVTLLIAFLLFWERVSFFDRHSDHRHKLLSIWWNWQLISNIWTIYIESSNRLSLFDHWPSPH